MNWTVHFCVNTSPLIIKPPVVYPVLEYNKDVEAPVVIT